MFKGTEDSLPSENRQSRLIAYLYAIVKLHCCGHYLAKFVNFSKFQYLCNVRLDYRIVSLLSIFKKDHVETVAEQNGEGFKFYPPDYGCLLCA